MKNCTCVGRCGGREGLGEGWQCIFDDQLDTYCDVMPRDHIGPLPGKCFMSLNFTEQQIGPVQEAIASNFPQCGVEESVVKICREWLEHKDLIDAQPQLLKSFHELLDFAEGTAGDNKGRPWDWIEKAKLVLFYAEGNT